ncbi:AAA family ATPase [Betaproteobacteria bacterium LSUCC0117]|nr:AAA family ATPase [Betaproteobacteria bacterium LSUCC0117]
MQLPDQSFSARELFGLETDLRVNGFASGMDLVPPVDPAYQFQPEVTQAILAGFMHNKRVLVQGFHGSGKSSHIEQVAARLNWPCMRVNLDGHITRLDLVGKDTVVMQDGHQVTKFQEGILPWCMRKPIALILDEYDAGRPDVMFVIQRVLEREGSFTLMEQNRTLHPHKAFRLFATANTVGQGNVQGLYHGVQQINQAQMDRWNLVVALNYLPPEKELAILTAQVPSLAQGDGVRTANAMIAMANLTRQSYAMGDLSVLMSPRTLINWGENAALFQDRVLAFKLSYLNKCEPSEHPLIAELYQRCFGENLPLADAGAASRA